LTASSSTTNVLCRGNSTGAINLTVSGGTSPYSYLWNDGITTQNRSNIPAATYSVTITDANSCSVSNTGIAVTQPAAALSVTTSPTNPSCNGSTNGAITATVSGGTSPYTYDWTGSPTGDGTNTITGLSAGTYTVTVTDANGCSETVTTTLSQSAALVLSTTSVNPTCPSGATAPLGSDGSIDLTVSGGTSPYSYSWTTTSGSGLVPTNQDQTGLSEGTYSVLVTDAAGCTANLSIILNNINPSPVQPGTINNN
jgi:hypothetical protein